MTLENVLPTIVRDAINEHQYVFAILITLFIPLFYQTVTFDKRRRHLPPGPKGYPFIGNLTALANADAIPSITREWSRKYGPIVYTKMGATDWIWLNKGSVVKELMDKRGNRYSSRQRLPMAFDNTSNGNRIIFMPYGERWRSLRKISHAGLNLRTSASYKPIQDFESKQVLYEFLHAKDDREFYDINRRYSASVIMTVTYGHRVRDWNDPAIKKIYKVLDHFTRMSEPGAWLVDVFPSLSNLPSWMMQNWWNIGREWFAYDREVYLSFYRDLIHQIRAGTAPDCFVKDFYESDPEKNGINEEQAAYAAGGLVEAGSESTSTVINAWILACQMFPDAVKQAQEELDRVIGPDRLPNFEDEGSLPYIRCMVKETLRWWPITKTGMMHSTSVDDWYDGYFIPKGAAVMLNWWAIHWDEERWQNPSDFDPRRYLDDPHTTAESVNVNDGNLRDHFTYGAGRRICAGMHLAQNSLFINIARTLWAFDITRSIDSDGQEIQPKIVTEPGFLMVPARFRARILPRSDRHAAIVEKAWSETSTKGVHLR